MYEGFVETLLPESNAPSKRGAFWLADSTGVALSVLHFTHALIVILTKRKRFLDLTPRDRLPHRLAAAGAPCPGPLICVAGGHLARVPNDVCAFLAPRHQRYLR